jgi:hypothetical protein
MQVRVEVELDIFSGMPNPAWVLDDTQALRFKALLSAASQSSQGELANNLGYRGFIVTVYEGGNIKSVRIQNGTVHVSKEGSVVRLKDGGRGLERWLFDAAKPHLTPELFQTIQREF